MEAMNESTLTLINESEAWASPNDSSCLRTGTCYPRRDSPKYDRWSRARRRAPEKGFESNEIVLQTLSKSSSSSHVSTLAASFRLIVILCASSLLTGMYCASALRNCPKRSSFKSLLTNRAENNNNNNKSRVESTKTLKKYRIFVFVQSINFFRRAPRTCPKLCRLAASPWRAPAARSRRRAATNLQTKKIKFDKNNQIEKNCLKYRPNL